MTIEKLEWYDLSAVMFVRDYIQFLFEGEQSNGVLTAYNLPVTTVNGHIFNRHTNGYRDILCSLINKKVKKSEITIDRSIKITFENRDELVVPLELSGQHENSEAAMLRMNNSIFVW